VVNIQALLLPEWWLILGSSGGSLVATPDCKLQSWVQIQQSPQPTVDCQSLDGQPSGMALCCKLSSEGRQRRIYNKKNTKKNKGKKKIYKHCTVGAIYIGAAKSIGASLFAAVLMYLKIFFSIFFLIRRKFGLF
jgi:hypothetical protein